MMNAFDEIFEALNNYPNVSELDNLLDSMLAEKGLTRKDWDEWWGEDEEPEEDGWEFEDPWNE